MSDKYQATVRAYADQAPRFGYALHTLPTMTHDVLALVVKAHPHLCEQLSLDANQLADNLNSMDFIDVGLMVVAKIILGAKRELMCDIDAELLRRASREPRLPPKRHDWASL